MDGKHANTAAGSALVATCRGSISLLETLHALLVQLDCDKDPHGHLCEMSTLARLLPVAQVV